MPEFAETDERVIFAKQLEEDTGTFSSTRFM